MVHGSCRSIQKPVDFDISCAPVPFAEHVALGSDVAVLFKVLDGIVDEMHDVPVADFEWLEDRFVLPCGKVTRLMIAERPAIEPHGLPLGTGLYYRKHPDAILGQG